MDHFQHENLIPESSHMEILPPGKSNPGIRVKTTMDIYLFHQGYFIKRIDDHFKSLQFPEKVTEVVIQFIDERGVVLHSVILKSENKSDDDTKTRPFSNFVSTNKELLKNVTKWSQNAKERHEGNFPNHKGNFLQGTPK